VTLVTPQVEGTLDVLGSQAGRLFDGRRGHDCVCCRGSNRHLVHARGAMIDDYTAREIRACLQNRRAE
jgi:hypothetical protein